MKRKLKRRQQKKPDRQVDDIWAEAASRTGGTLVGRGKKPEIRVDHEHWAIIVDKHVVSNGQAATVYTRTRAYYLANDDFGFSVTKRAWYSKIAAFFRAEANVRDQALEERYVFRTNHDSRLRSFLQDTDVRRLILRQPSLRLEVKGLGWWRRRKVGSRVRVLTARTTGVVTEVERIVNFIELIRSGVDTLQRIGTAVPQAVDWEEHNGEVGRRL